MAATEFYVRAIVEHNVDEIVVSADLKGHRVEICAIPNQLHAGHWYQGYLLAVPPGGHHRAHFFATPDVTPRP